MKKSIITGAVVALALVAPAQAAAAEFLTIREARAQTREHLRDAKDPGDILEYREIGPCYRPRQHIVDCEFYEELYDGGAFTCEGTIRVREGRYSYFTRGYGVDCY
jgi:hypothetical protein